MANSQQFSIGTLRVFEPDEHVFLSVTPGFEHGPGIVRDGITAPRMADPHGIAYVTNCHNIPVNAAARNDYTTDPFVQRAGTWTLYHHLRKFIQVMGERWHVIGVQSCGDLTMNPWHIAFLNRLYSRSDEQTICALLTDRGPAKEPIFTTMYRCLVKWNDGAANVRNLRHEFVDLRFDDLRGNRFLVTAADDEVQRQLAQQFQHSPDFDKTTGNIADLITFALSGKPIVEKRLDLPLFNATDRFQDVRHIFNLPEAEAEGSFEGRPVHKINFGEKQLFSNLNERRAALHSAVLIKLNPDDHVRVKWSKLKQELIEKRHFKDTGEVSPTHRGQFRVYSGQESTPETLEIFFKPNVYPFGVLGIRGKELVCLASGGLSGRIGNTLDGITRIMFDFFGCEDAIVLDEGYDTFQIANLNRNGNGQTPEYSNEALLEKALQFTKQRLEADHGESLAEAKRQTAADPSYRYPDGLKSYPLNSQIVRDVESASIDASVSCEDVLVVKPHRSQMRSVLIFAVKKHPR